MSKTLTQADIQKADGGHALPVKPGVAPKGVIEFANEAAGRFALRTKSGGYTIFQLRAQGVVLVIDDTVSGDLEALAVQSYRIGGVGDVNVFVEKAGLTHLVAEAWVGCPGRC